MAPPDPKITAGPFGALNATGGLLSAVRGNVYDSISHLTWGKPTRGVDFTLAFPEK